MITNEARQLYVRKALNQALQGIWQYPLTAVEAPMGYGKTTAVREYLKGSEARVLWQTVFAASAAGFWQGFSRLFAGVDPSCAERLAAMGIPGDSVFREEAVELLGGVKFAAHTVIVVDDYHLLASPAIDLFFERLARAAIPGLHVVIVSRRKFGENTAELTLKGHCLVLDRKQFELSPAETAEYCRLCGVRLKDEEAAFLQEYAEGWISAVYLCILGYRQSGRLERQSATLNDLVDKVVYQPCAAEVKEFLIAISIFDNFSLPQAEHIWQKGNAEALLAELTAENSFITFDQSNGIYSLHNILTGYLRRIFDRKDPDKRQAAWRMAGEWYLSVCDYNHAMDYFYMAGEFDRLMRTIEVCDIHSFALQPQEARLSYFRECPQAVKERHPGAGVHFYYNLMLSNEPALCDAQYREVTGFIDNALWLDDWVRRQMKGALEFLKAFSAYNDLAAMRNHYQAALDLLQGPAEFLDKRGVFTFGLPSLLYMYYRESGGLAAAVRTIGEITPVYHRLIDGHGAGAEYLMEAEHHYYVGDFDNAEIVAHKALHIAESKRETSIILCVHFLMVRLALVKGDWAYVQGGLQRLREMIKQQSLYPYIYTLDMCEGLIFACLNRRERIPAWLADGEIPGSLFHCCHAFCHIIQAKALLIGGRHRELVGIAGQLAATAAYYPNMLALVYIQICEAAALDKLGCRQDALATLAKAVAVAAPDRVVMPFVENGEHVDRLLAELQAAGQHPEFIAKVRSLYPSVAARWRAIAAKLGSPAGRRPLTVREAEICQLVAEGLSNRAIGKTLSIAPVTVQKTLTNVFVKMGVSNRTMLTKVLVERQGK